MKFILIGPGFQAQIEEDIIINPSGKSQLKLVVEKYKQKIESGELFEIEVADEGGIILYKPVPGQHLVIMTETQFNKMRREQMFAARNVPGGING